MSYFPFATDSLGYAQVDLMRVNDTAITLGQAAMAASFPVTIASNQTAISVTTSGNSAVNLTQVGGAAIAIGQAAMAASLPVVFASNQSALTVAQATASSLNATVVQATAASLNATVVGTGTFVVQAAQSGTWNIGTLTSITNALPAGTNLLGKVGIDQTTVGTTNAVSLAQLGANTVSTGNGTSGTGVLRVAQVSDGTGVLASISTSVVPGTSATHLGKAEDAAAASGDTGVFILGVRNETLASPTSTDGDYSQLSMDSLGRALIANAPTAAFVSGNATTTGTSDVSVVASAGGSLKNYIVSVQIANTGATTSLITFKNGSGGSTLGTTIAPAGCGSNITFETPLITSAATAFYFTAASSSTTIYCSAQGYKAP